jgi:hypothetical protein
MLQDDTEVAPPVARIVVELGGFLQVTSSFKPPRRNDLRDPPLSAGDLCRPSGLTARDRPEARPGTRGDEISSMLLA